MTERLADLAKRADPGLSITVGAERRVAYFRDRVAGTTGAEQKNMRLRLADELLRKGDNRESLQELIALLQAMQKNGGRLGLGDIKTVGYYTSTCHLRIAEQENCQARHGPESCLLPIRGGGVHTQPRGSRQAIRELQTLLRLDPKDLASRWLLNICSMTLGEFPDGVPEAQRIPSSVFESEHDVSRFTNVAPHLGLDVSALSGGVVTEDLDGDGLLDVMVSSWGLRDPLRLFRNNGDGTFTERTAEAGLTGLHGGLNLCHADYDNDGDIDVLVLRGAWLQREGRHPNSLLRNDGKGRFDDVTEEAGLLSFHPTQTATWADLDNDGWVDLFIGNESLGEESHPCELFHNDGDGTFTERAAEVGVALQRFVKGVACGDFDDDGRRDLYLSCNGDANVLLRNELSADGEWSFRDVTESAGVAEPIRSFPAWFWDYDNDGRLDLFVAPFPGFTADSLGDIVAGYLGEPTDAERPRLYRNLGKGKFRDVSAAVGIDQPMLVMGANFGDLDNDGFLDMVLGTGEPSLRTLVPNRAYRNDGGTRFQNVTFSGRFGHLQKGHGIAFADFDNDGDQDIYAVMGGAYVADVAFNALFLNPGHGHRWITLQLEGTKSNRAAFGARIRVTVKSAAGSRSIHRVVSTGASFGSSSLQQEIGLGDAETVEGIEIRWPSGTTETLGSVTLDRHYRIREGDGKASPWPRAEIELRK